MSTLRNSINDLAHDLHEASLINKQTLRSLTKNDIEKIEGMHIYTAEEIKELRLKQNVSQSIFAKYLNISPKMVMALEGGQKKAQGAILRLLNIIEKHGLEVI